MRTSLMAAAAALLALASAPGCSDDDEPDSADYRGACERACSRGNECDSTLDTAECSMMCQQQFADIGPRLSAAFGVEVDGCIQQLTCPELASDLVVLGCFGEARQRVSPSSAVTSFCEALAEKAQMCLGVDLGPQGCVERYKIFSDSAVTRARACLERSCDQVPACLDMEVPTLL